MTKKQKNRGMEILKNKGISEGTFVEANDKVGVCRISTCGLNDNGEVPFEYTKENGDFTIDYVDADELVKITEISNE